MSENRQLFIEGCDITIHLELARKILDANSTEKMGGYVVDEPALREVKGQLQRALAKIERVLNRGENSG